MANARSCGNRSYGNIVASALAACLSLLPAIARGQVDPAVLQAEQARVAVVARCIESTVAVFSPGGQGGGSGVVISPDGYVLSNFHVTSSTGDAMQCGMSDGKLYDAVIVGIDPTGDVALLKLLGRDDFPAAEMGDSDRVRVGDWCFTVGNPFLLATDFQPSVAYGVISGVHRYQYPAGTILEYADCLQADAAINPGNSGGPMFDDAGRLIGINGRGSFEKRGRVNVGVGYAISINQIKNFLGHLKSGRIVDHATLGAVVRSDNKRRVLVDDILENSDAYRRGLRYGDEIVAFGGRDIATVNEFKNVLGIFPRDWRVPLSFRRKGQRFDILVRLRGVHAQIELEEMVAAESETPGEDPHDAPGDEHGEPGKERPDGEPKDSEEPKDGEPEKEEPGGKPGGEPLPIPAPGMKKKAPMPEIVRQHFEKKSGYVNYFFNQRERERVWAALVSHGNDADCLGMWTVSGNALESGSGREGGGEDFRLQFSDTEAAIKLPAGELRVTLDGGLSTHLDPPGSGGMLVSLSLWRRLLVEGPDKFGKVFYLGTMPLRMPAPLQSSTPSESPAADQAAAATLCDVISAAHDDVECLFYFDPANGNLVSLEMFPEDDADPCELYFSDFKEFQGHWLPGQIEVRHGDGYSMAFTCQQYAWEVDKAKEGGTDEAK